MHYTGVHSLKSTTRLLGKCCPVNWWHPVRRGSFSMCQTAHGQVQLAERLYHYVLFLSACPQTGVYYWISIKRWLPRALVPNSSAQGPGSVGKIPIRTYRNFSGFLT